jgi:hypothetical protein
MDEYDLINNRIAKIFGAEEPPRVTRENLLKYREYILERFDRKKVLTGHEDFPWEEFYVLGPGNPAEYKRLKKKRPSYTDEYRLIDIQDRIEENDLNAEVTRLSDKKFFVIGLSWLEAKEKNTEDAQLLEDYSFWQVNWR